MIFAVHVTMMYEVGFNCLGDRCLLCLHAKEGCIIETYCKHNTSGVQSHLFA